MKALSLLMCMFILLPGVPLAAELPGDSYYQLDAALETDAGATIPFASLQGNPVIVSMFYGSCPHVCPMLIASIREIEKQLPEDARAKLRVAMISIDPKRDTPAALNEIATRHGVNNERWLLARTSLADTRTLAAVLGIKYKALPDGEFNHTTAIILLDAEGREVERSGKLGSPDPAFVGTIGSALRETESGNP